MYLFNCLKQVLTPDDQYAKTKNLHVALVMADWIEDNCQGHPELNIYLTRLRKPDKLRLHTLIETVAKFGEKAERSLVRKVVKKMLDSKKTWYGGYNGEGRKTCRSRMRKHYSFRLKYNPIKVSLRRNFD